MTATLVAIQAGLGAAFAVGAFGPCRGSDPLVSGAIVRGGTPAIRNVLEYHCGTTKYWWRSTRSSARRRATSSGRVCAETARFTSASIAGSLIPIRLLEPSVSADAEPKRSSSQPPGICPAT